MLACHPCDLPGDEEESHAAEDKVPPLVSVSLELWTMYMKVTVPCKMT